MLPVITYFKHYANDDYKLTHLVEEQIGKLINKY